MPVERLGVAVWRRRPLRAQASCSRSALIRAARVGVWTIARLRDCRGATAAISPSAPSGPIVVLSIAAPLSMRVIKEITPSCGK
jgi:hypothetical protein